VTQTATKYIVSGNKKRPPIPKAAYQILILRYLVEKGKPMSAAQTHLEITFCNACDKWDLSEEMFKKIVDGMVDAHLLIKIDAVKGKVFGITEEGIEYLRCFLIIDENIANQRWKI
jgi:predicted transcriptional regulator